MSVCGRRFSDGRFFIRAKRPRDAVHLSIQSLIGSSHMYKPQLSCSCVPGPVHLELLSDGAPLPTQENGDTDAAATHFN